MEPNKISPDDPRLTRLRPTGFGEAGTEQKLFNGTGT